MLSIVTAFLLIQDGLYQISEETVEEDAEATYTNFVADEETSVNSYLLDGVKL